MSEQGELGLGKGGARSPQDATRAVFGRLDAAKVRLGAALGVSPAEAIKEARRREEDRKLGPAAAVELHVAGDPPPPERPVCTVLPSSVSVELRADGSADVLDGGADYHRRIGRLLDGSPVRFLPTCPSIMYDRSLRALGAPTAEAWAKRANEMLAESAGA